MALLVGNNNTNDGAPFYEYGVVVVSLFRDFDDDDFDSIGV